MNWKHYSLQNEHAFLSPSKYHWINYDEQKLRSAYINYKRTALGTKYHAIAAELITYAIRLPNNSSALNAFVNDAIGYKMQPEQLLYYSSNCYGTADAISYSDGILRIHDLKSGLYVSPGTVNQLLIYAALFCLDYKERPEKIYLRLYQNEEVIEYNPEYDEIEEIMFKIEEKDRIITETEADYITAL